jgi:hypothetical protein
MARVLTHNIDVEFIDCANCGQVFGMTAEFIKRRRADGKEFFCPNGHSNFYRDNEHDRVRQERDRLKQQLAQKDDTIAYQRAQREAAEKLASVRKGQVTRLKNRAAAGVCPCCNRTVSQMAKHMASKHPTFKAEEVV